MFGIDDAALAVMLAGGISTAASLYTNKKNRESQENANAINWEIARQNNATQIEMANTAHQREVRDLRRAGLNPILSAGGSGAATPTLQSPIIDPVHTDNAFEGLANSAKGLTRYLGSQFRQQELSNQALEVSNDMAREDLLQQQRLNDAERDSLTSERLRSAVDKIATLQETGLSAHPDPLHPGELKVDISSPEQLQSAVNLAREGIRSDMKLRSNANWRANLSSFTPFVSPAAINSASSALRGGHPTRRSYIP